MTKFTRVERERLKALVQDTVVYRLTERESLDYIKSRLGKQIGPVYYYRLKKRLESDSNAQDWINRFARTGFISEHMRRYHEMNLLQDVAFHMLIEEQAKPDGIRDPDLILAIMDQITKNGKTLTSLQNGTPVLAQVKTLLEGKQQQPQLEIRVEEQERLSLLSPYVRSQIMSIVDPQRRMEVEQALIAAAKAEEDDDKPEDFNNA